MAKNVQATWSTTKRVARGTGGMVAAQHKAAADVGAAVLQGGGNAVDAAIATSLALAVLEPWMSGLGGGGFLVVATPDGRTEALDFGMVAPSALDPSAYPLERRPGQRPVRLARRGRRSQRHGPAVGRGAAPGGGAGLRLRAPRQHGLARPLRAGDRACRPGPAGRLAHQPADHHRRGRPGPVRGGRRPVSAGRPAAAAGRHGRAHLSADRHAGADPAPPGRRRSGRPGIGRSRPPAGRGRAGSRRRAFARRPGSASRNGGGRAFDPPRRCPDPGAGRADGRTDAAARAGADRRQGRRGPAGRRGVPRLGGRPASPPTRSASPVSATRARRRAAPAARRIFAWSTPRAPWSA